MDLEFWLELLTKQSWQLVFVVAMAMFVARWLGRTRAHLAYVLWLLVLLKCLAPPIWSSPLGVFGWLQSAADYFPANLLASRDNQTLRQASDFFESDGTAQRDLALRSSHTVRLTAPLNSAASASLRSRWSFGKTILGVWFVGSVVVVGVSLFRIARFTKTLRRAPSYRDLRLESLVENLRAELGVRRIVRVLVTKSLIGPCVMGLFRPTLVFPAAILAGKTDDELRPLVAHELIHVRRGDLLWSALQIIGQGLWWFHPLVWFANRRLAREAERCCDEEVIAGLGCPPPQYARALLLVLEQKHQLQTVPVFPGVKPFEITFSRMERIMEMRQGCRSRTPVWCWLALLCGALLLLPGRTWWLKAKEPSTPQGQATSKVVLPNPPKNATQNEKAADPTGKALLSITVSVLAGEPADMKKLWEAIPDIAKPSSEAEKTKDSLRTKVTARLDEKQLGELLAKQANIRTLSEPKIRALEEQEARIQVGSEFPTEEPVVNDDGSIGKNLRFLFDGYSVTILPKCLGDGEFHLDIQAKVSSVSEKTLNGRREYGLTETELSTAAQLRSDQSFLFMRDDIQTKQKTTEARCFIFSVEKVPAALLDPNAAPEINLTTNPPSESAEVQPAQPHCKMIVRAQGNDSPVQEATLDAVRQVGIDLEWHGGGQLHETKDSFVLSAKKGTLLFEHPNVDSSRFSAEEIKLTILKPPGTPVPGESFELALSGNAKTDLGGSAIIHANQIFFKSNDTIDAQGEVRVSTKDEVSREWRAERLQMHISTWQASGPMSYREKLKDGNYAEVTATNAEIDDQGRLVVNGDRIAFFGGLFDMPIKICVPASSEMVLNLPFSIPKIVLEDPTLLEAEPLTPNAVRFRALKAGETVGTFWNEKDESKVFQFFIGFAR